jgi:hypothetical protein
LDYLCETQGQEAIPQPGEPEALRWHLERLLPGLRQLAADGGLDIANL